MATFVIGLVMISPGFPVKASENINSGATVLAYSRLGDTPESLDQDRFETQIKMIKQGGYRVISLPELARHLHEGEDFPDKTIALTFDNAYASLWQFAIPILRENGLPFTLFLATDLIDGGGADYLSWPQIQELAKDPNISFGLRGAAHLHLIDAAPQTLIADIRQAKRRLREQTGLETTVFSYPYGEYNDTVISLLRDQGIDTAFGSHSGVVALASDPMALPRFPVSASFGDPDRFQLIINALPLLVYDPKPIDTMVAGKPLDEISFSIDDAVGDLSGLRCFASDQGQVPVNITSQRRVTVRINFPFAPGRARINCTIPAANDRDGNPRWRWYGRQFTIEEN